MDFREVKPVPVHVCNSQERIGILGGSAFRLFLNTSLDIRHLGHRRPTPSLRQCWKVGVIWCRRLFVFGFPIRRGFLACFGIGGELIFFPFAAAFFENASKQLGGGFDGSQRFSTGGQTFRSARTTGRADILVCQGIGMTDRNVRPPLSSRHSSVSFPSTAAFSTAAR